MSAVFSGNTPGVGGLCDDFDTNASELNRALADAEILTNGVLTLTQIDGSTFTNNIPYFADFVISGLNLNISNVPVNRTLTYTAGTYQINAQVYSIPVGANFQLTAGHPTLPRIDILYLTNTNNIIYQTGVPSVNPVQPTPPAGTLLLAAIGVQINATTSLNYTLVTVNTNASNIVPPVLTPGTVTGSHLYWDGLTWSENTFWNVSNSTIDPTARIHTYTDTDSSGVVTTAVLGDGDDGGRGFKFIVNDTLDGYSGIMSFHSPTGSPTVFSIFQDDSNLFRTSILNTTIDSFESNIIDATIDRSCYFKQTETSNILEANLSTKDPLNTNEFTQTLTTTISRLQQGIKTAQFAQAVLSNQTVITNNSGTGNIGSLELSENIFSALVQDSTLTNDISITASDLVTRVFQDPTNKNEITQTLTDTESLITQGTNISSFGQDLSNGKNTLNITDGVGISCTLTQDAGSGINTFGVANGSFNSYIEQKVIGLSQANTINLNNNNLELKFLQNLDFNIQSLSIENTVSNINTMYIQKINNHLLTTDVNYLLTGSSRSVLDMYDSTAYIYNRNQPLTKNSEIQLNHTTGTLIKYEDSVTPTNNASINLFAGKTNINSGLRLKQRNTAISLTVVNDDYVIIVTAVPRTITLPLAPVDGETYIVKSNGVATGGNPITVSGNGKNIDSAANAFITTTNGSVRVIFNNTLNKWFTI